MSIRGLNRSCFSAFAVASLLVLAACGQTPGEAEPADAGSLARVRLMTDAQYANAVAQVFGEDVGSSVIPPMPPMARTDGLLASGAAFAGLTSDQISQIQQAAAFVAAQVVDEAHRDFLLPCTPLSPTEPDAACAVQFLGEAGRLLARRPLEDARLEELVEIAGRAAEQTGSFHDGLALALEALLISPEFLFIVDRTEPDPERPGAQRLDSYSLAARLSFFLWNAPPDDALLRAAATGELHTEAGLARAVDRLLESPRLEDGMRAFFDDMLAFDEFDSLAKDPLVYPMVTGTTLAHAREQTLRTLVDHLLTREEDYRDLFTTRRTFMSMPLAVVYGTPAGNGWVPYEFEEDSPRRGILTHVSFLAANSHAVRSSPTQRGKALRELFLCQRVPDPPPNVDFSLLEDAGDVPTARERLAVHNTNPSCAGCHLITDPMGLSLENFDGAGRYRETENGAELDIAGELDGVFYEDIGGLAEALRDHPKLSYCLVNRLYAYGTGGPVSLRDDRDRLRWFEERFAEHAYRVPALLRDLALSRSFSAIRPASQPDDRVAGSGFGVPIEAEGTLATAALEEVAP
ncbi:MAG: DUF1592 domain-containing protein [Pseudomonadales bacterium]|nr:DUF1592 domain-containing protein [Pseudomonadales bacterium]